MNLLKLPLLLLFAPRFLQDMPPAGSGQFVANATKSSRFYHHTANERPVAGRRRAYIEARWMALVLDWRGASDWVSMVLSLFCHPAVRGATPLSREHPLS